MVTIYHNPACSKSRQTLALIREQGFEPEIIDYLTTPPDKADLDAILSLLGLEPRELMRKKENACKANDLANPDLSNEQLINAMIDNPVLIERPIVLANGKAALGRPPENVLEIL